MTTPELPRHLINTHKTYKKFQSWGISLFAHGLLALALFFSTRWQITPTEPSVTTQTELWTTLPPKQNNSSQRSVVATPSNKTPLPTVQKNDSPNAIKTDIALKTPKPTRPSATELNDEITEKPPTKKIPQQNTEPKKPEPKKPEPKKPEPKKPEPKKPEPKKPEPNEVKENKPAKNNNIKKTPKPLQDNVNADDLYAKGQNTLTKDTKTSIETKQTDGDKNGDVGAYQSKITSCTQSKTRYQNDSGKKLTVRFRLSVRPDGSITSGLNAPTKSSGISEFDDAVGSTLESCVRNIKPPTGVSSINITTHSKQ